ncbi:MAG: hypothetical protein LBD16_06800, partial [Oscillospiraceae bacterium]|nr:hypothetical protein [Oscillospiraceae bacterium]
DTGPAGPAGPAGDCADCTISDEEFEKRVLKVLIKYNCACGTLPSRGIVRGCGRSGGNGWR